MAPVRSHHIHIGVCALYSNKHYNVCVLNTTTMANYRISNDDQFSRFWESRWLGKSENNDREMRLNNIKKNKKIEPMGPISIHILNTFYNLTTSYM